MNEKEIMHELILTREAAKRLRGTELGSLNQQRCDELFKMLSDASQVMMALGAPDENIGQH